MGVNSLPPRAGVALLTAAGLLFGAVLTGCSSTTTQPTEPVATALNSLPAESSQSPSAAAPTATPTATPASFRPVGQSCSILLPSEFVFDVGPNFARQDDYSPDAGSTDAFIVQNQGVACRIVNLSGGDYIDVAVVGIDGTGRSDLINQLSSTASEVNDFGNGIVGFFGASNSVAQAHALTESYWVVVSSPLFGQASDAAPFVAQVLSALS